MEICGYRVRQHVHRNRKGKSQDRQAEHRLKNKTFSLRFDQSRQEVIDANRQSHREEIDQRLVDEPHLVECAELRAVQGTRQDHGDEQEACVRDSFAQHH